MTIQIPLDVADDWKVAVHIVVQIQEVWLQSLLIAAESHGR